MRKNSLALSILYLTLVFASSVFAGSLNSERSTWVWQYTDRIINGYFDNDGSNTREKFLSFCEAPHGDASKRIKNLYMAAHSYMMIHPDKTRRFLADMNNRGFKVYLVLGDPESAIPTQDPYNYDSGGNIIGYGGCYNDKFKKYIEGNVSEGIPGIIPFQLADNGGKQKERFAGIMLDIEPYQLGKGLFTDSPYRFDDHFDIVWRTYLSNLDFCKSKIDTFNASQPNNESKMYFSDAFSAEFKDRGDTVNPGKKLFDSILERVHFFTLMNYRDNADNDTTDAVVYKKEFSRMVNDLDSLWVQLGNKGYIDNNGDNDGYVQDAFRGLNNPSQLQVNIPEPDNENKREQVFYMLKEGDLRGKGLIYWAKDIVQKSLNSGKQCVIAVETQKNPQDSNDIPAYITFAEEGDSFMESQLAQLVGSINTNGFNGFSIHSYADNESTIYRGYQHLASANQDKAPVVTVTAPNGLKIDGISFNGAVNIAWKVYNPNNSNYDVNIYYEYENDSSKTWHLITSIPNVSSSVKQSSYLWNTSKKTETEKRIFVKVEVSYASGAPLTTFDTTDYSIAVNETSIPDKNLWSDTAGVVFGAPSKLGLKIIHDDDGVLHACYSMFYGVFNDSNYSLPGVYYSKSVDGGKTWVINQNLATSASYDTSTKKSTWPRKASFSKNGRFMAVAWVECNNKIFQGDLDNSKIYIRFSDDNGQNWKGCMPDTNALCVVDSVSLGHVNFPNLFIDAKGNVFIVWSGINNSSGWASYIYYKKYFYNNGNWNSSTRQEITKNTSLSLNSPAVCKTANNKVYAVWGEYSVVSPFTMTIKSNFKPNENDNDNWNINNIKTFYTRNYPESQRLPGAPTISNDRFNYNPVYFPKLAFDGNKLYAVWQVTLKGSALNQGIEQSSEVYFASLDTSSDSNLWTPNASPYNRVADSGFAPEISVWKAASNTVAQVVYSNNFGVYDSNPNNRIDTGDLVYKQSLDSGVNWSASQLLASGSGVASGIRIPYYNNIERAVNYFSYPFIYTSNGVTTASWYNGGSDKDNPDELYKVKNYLYLKELGPPFVDLNDNDGNFIVKWHPPESGVAPSGYLLYRITDGGYPQLVNGGNPIYTLSYVDNDSSLTSSNYYRYKVYYLIGSNESIISTQSNAIKIVNYNYELIINDFEQEGYFNLSYNQYSNDDTALIALKTQSGVMEEAKKNGNAGLKIVYNPSELKTAASYYIGFPTLMDISKYGSVDVWLKCLPGGFKRDISFNLILTNPNNPNENMYYPLGRKPQVVDNDGQWHKLHFYLDSARSGEFGKGWPLYPDLIKIKAISIGFYEKDNDTIGSSTTFYLDDIVFNNKPVFEVDRQSFPTVPIYNDGMIKAKVLNEEPVNINIGNMPRPWNLRVYTLDEVDNDGTKIRISKNGLIRKQGNRVYPDYNIPLKVWTPSYGPPRFTIHTADDGITDIPSHYTKGYPPVNDPADNESNSYFFRGFDFDKDKRVVSRFDYVNQAISSGKFVENLNTKINFDIDGDGFRNGDDFFSATDQNPVNGERNPNKVDFISESPVWLFVPLYKSVGPWPDAPDDEYGEYIIMNPNKPITWRNIATSANDGGSHIFKVHFAASIGLEQCDYGKYPDNEAYGQYTGSIIIDLAYN